MTTSIPLAANPTTTAAPRARLAKVLSIGCLLAAIALPAFSLYLSFADPGVLIKGLGLPKPLNEADLTAFQRIAAALIAVIAPLLQAYGLLGARRCFQSFARGEFFTLSVVKSLRRFALGFFFAVMAGMVATPLLSLVLTMNAGAGQHTITLNFGSDEVLRLLFAGVLWQIAAVMMHAVKLAEENSQFV